jgi:hypothetical protein
LDAASRQKYIDLNAAEAAKLAQVAKDRGEDDGEAYLHKRISTHKYGGEDDEDDERDEDFEGAASEVSSSESSSDSEETTADFFFLEDKRPGSSTS